MTGVIMGPLVGRILYDTDEDIAIACATSVGSWAEKDEAQRAAYSVAGVSAVDNRISLVR